ncbi:MAG: hypothetical protein NT027_13685 [Proteobacteria bacterium]|nr:hypothetical protein [Pseudomonadota bacterium]
MKINLIPLNWIYIALLLSADLKVNCILLLKDFGKIGIEASGFAESMKTPIGRQSNQMSAKSAQATTSPLSIKIIHPATFTLVLKEKQNGQFHELKNSHDNLEKEPFIPKIQESKCTRIYVGDDWNTYVPVPSRKKIPKFIFVCQIKKFPVSTKDVLTEAKGIDAKYWTDKRLNLAQDGDAGFLKLNQKTNSGLKYSAIGITLDGGENRLLYLLNTNPPVGVFDGSMIDIINVHE